MGDDRDQLYARARDMIIDFRFDTDVANVFPDMIRRSVPGYDTIMPLLGLFAERYGQSDSNIYDLGCSLGAATIAMRRYLDKPGCQIIAVDSAEAMIAQCRANLEISDADVPVSLHCEDIRDIEIVNASLVVMNFTLQFIPPDQRLALLERIYKGMRAGGALIIADKIVFTNPAQQRFEQDLHLDFKKANGYSELEISQKRTALENVLIPDSMETHLARLHQAGFAQAYAWFQCFNFTALCAIK